MINCIGQMFGSSGYANHFRYLVNELNKITECKIITGLYPGFERDVNDQELEMIKKEQDYDINLIVTHPVNWKSNLNAKRNWVYLIWEGDRVPVWIMQECFNENIEKIIVPSEHTKKALMETLTDNAFHTADEVLDKLVVIPHGVDLKTFYPMNVAIDPVEGRTQVPFKFLANKGLRNLEDRGGVQYLIKAYLEEFTESSNVELIIKLNPAYGIPNLKELFPRIKENGIPKITFITEEYTPKQLNELYNECDVFVSPTRAEAFNLPCIEAMACGKPVITTNFGGQTDFVTDSNGWLVDYELTEVTHELEYESICWADPNLNHLKSLLRYSFEHTDEVLSKGKDGLYVSKNYTWYNTAKQISSLTEKYIKVLIN